MVFNNGRLTGGSVVLDPNDQVFLRRIGATCYYGDASRLELLHSAGTADARILIIAIDDEDDCMKIIDHCHKHFPQLRILARACSRNHAYLLHEAGVEYFVIPLPLITAHSSLASHVSPLASHVSPLASHVSPLASRVSRLSARVSRLSARVSKTYQIGILRLRALFPFHVRVPI